MAQADDGTEIVCDECSCGNVTLYTVWCYTSQRNNPFAVGTVSANLMQNRTLCIKCVRKYYDAGLTKLENRP